MKVLAIIIFIFCSSFISAQVYKHKSNISLGYSFGKIDTSFYNCGSLRAEAFVGNHIGLNWNFDYLLRSDDVRQLHAPMGIVGGPILIAWGLSDLEEDETSGESLRVLLGVLMLVLPDGITLHVPVGTSWDIAPYVNFIGIDFIKNRITGESDIHYACSIGTKLTYVHRDIATFSFFGETRRTPWSPWSIGAGFGVGLLFGSR